MKVTSNYSLRDKYRKTTLGNLNTDTSNLIQEVAVETPNKKYPIPLSSFEETETLSFPPEL
jgi:hypothetical protein